MNAFAADRGTGDSVLELSCAPAKESSDRSAAPGRAAAVLVASGSVELRRTLTEILNGAGHRVSAVDNGEAVLEMLKEGRFDLVIASVSMPRIDGLELLRAVSGKKDSPPVIVVAAGHGKIDQVYLKCADLLGAAHSFLQPLRPKSFLAAVAEALKSPSKRIAK